MSPMGANKSGFFTLATPTLPTHTPPKKGKCPNMLSVQSTSLSKSHTLKLWQFQTNLLKILPEKWPKEPFQKHQTGGHLEFFKKTNLLSKIWPNEPVH